MTLNKFFHLDVVTPEGIIFTGDTISCQAPGVSGGFQILPGHTGLISSLAMGLLKVETVDNAESFISIIGGFLEVEGDKIIVLSDAAEMSDKIDIKRAQKSKQRALDRIETPQPDINMERAHAALKRALNRLKIAEIKRS